MMLPPGASAHFSERSENTMKRTIHTALLLCFLSLTVLSQDEIVTVVSIVKVKNEKRAEADFYYEQNWKQLRKLALAEGIIHSYEFIEAKADEQADFDYLCITRFRDQAQFDKAEENFARLMEPRGGPKLLNELKPDEFREVVFVKIGKSLFVPGPDARKGTSGHGPQSDDKQ